MCLKKQKLTGLTELLRILFKREVGQDGGLGAGVVVQTGKKTGKESRKKRVRCEVVSRGLRICFYNPLAQLLKN